MKGMRGRNGDNVRRTPVSKQAYEYACVTQREGEAVTEALATFLKERVRKGREAGEVSRAPLLPPLGQGQKGVISPLALGDI